MRAIELSEMMRKGKVTPIPVETMPYSPSSTCQRRCPTMASSRTSGPGHGDDQLPSSAGAMTGNHDDLPEEEPFLILFVWVLFLMLHSFVSSQFEDPRQGIVKTVGLDQSATELLTGSEIDAFKANLELRALTICKPISILPVWIDWTNSSPDSLPNSSGSYLMPDAFYFS